MYRKFKQEPKIEERDSKARVSYNNKQVFQTVTRKIGLFVCYPRPDGILQIKLLALCHLNWIWIFQSILLHLQKQPENVKGMAFAHAGA